MTCITTNDVFFFRIIKSILTASVASLAFSTSVHADSQTSALHGLIQPAQFVEDNGSSERIDFSGKLRMLSQRIVAASCFLQAGVETEASRDTLAAATAEFALITDALEFGNPDLGIIGIEERRKTLAGIAKLRELWAPISVLADKVEAGEGTVADISAIAEQSAPLLEIAKRLVVQISSQYANQTSVLQSDAIAIDLAGRQRMLSQRISKNICLIASGVNVEASRAELAGAAQIFENTLNALRFGLVEAAIQAPKTDDIADGLAVVAENLALMLPLIAEITAGNSLDSEQLGIVFLTANLMTGNMNKVVGLYSEASKLSI
jgi:nitrate/nitrite-specific signal transduction histidine kinase